MPLPPPISKGEVITAKDLNSHRSETKRNTIVGATGMSFRRTPGGTTLGVKRELANQSPEGKLVTVINDTGRKLQPYWFAGIEKVTDRESMVGNYSDVNYVLREPEDTDLDNRLVMLAEPIEDKAVGKAYIRSDGILSRVLYDEGGDDDDFRFASIEVGGDGGNAYTLLAKETGQIAVLDVEDKQDDHPDWRWAVVRFPIGSASGALKDPFDLTFDDEHAEVADPDFYTNKDGVEVMFDFRELPQEAKDNKNQGLKFTISRGVAYYDDGDEILYQYVTNLHLDSSGKLTFITREKRAVIDDPEECTTTGGGDEVQAQQLMGG